MQAQAVEQLRFVGRQLARELGNLRGVGICVVFRGAGNHLADGHALEHLGHVFQGIGSAQTFRAQRFHALQNIRSIALRQGRDQAKHMAAIDRAEHLCHGLGVELPASEGDGLIRQAQCVAHRAARALGDQAQGLAVCRDGFLRQHLREVLHDRLRCHGPQIELQAAGEHRDGHFLGVGRGQDELEVLRGFLQGLEHGVEGVVGEHVDFIDHEDLKAPLHRFVDRLL